MKIKLPADSTRIQGIKAAMRKNGLHSVRGSIAALSGQYFGTSGVAISKVSLICTRRCPVL